MAQTTLQMYSTGYERQTSRISDDELRQKYGVDTIYRLSQNENPIGPSPKAVEAIQNVAPELNYYPNFSDIDLRQAIADLTGRGITPDHIYTGCSGFEAIEMLARGFVRAGDEVILCNPTFTGAYQKTTELQGGVIVDVPLDAETFAYDIDAIIAAITPKTRMILLCNPNNPTGTILSATQMHDLMSRVPSHVLVVSDEVYHQYVDNPDYPDSLQYVLDGKNLVLTYSFSKAYGLAGLRLGYGISTPEIANHLASLHRGFHQSKVNLAAGIAAVHDQAHIETVVSYTKSEMRWLLGELDRLNLKYWEPAANFVLIQTPLESSDITEKLMQAGILVRPQGRSGLSHCIRISIGTQEGNRAFIKRLEEIL